MKLRFLSVLLIGISLASGVCAGEVAAVAQAIDRDIQDHLQKAGIKPSARTEDAEFLRRITLDITGRIPTPQRAAAFLASSDPDKRRKLIDELLASPLYGDHFAARWTDRINAAGTPPRSMTVLYRSWLAEQFNKAQGWNKTVHAMLTAEGMSPAGYFVRANLGEPGLLADTTARFFLGVQLQCAECHNHPFTSFEQTDYWGLAAFYTRLKQIDGKGGKQLTEDSLPGKKSKTGPGARITIPTAGGNKGAGQVVNARFLLGTEPTLPDEGPLRPALADWITAADNPYFAKAAVNRLWAHLFGSGFINPVDDMHEDAQASHPELLQLLANELVASGYDLKHLLRCIANSDTYQRTSKPLPENKDDELYFSHMAVKVMTADVLFDSLVTALGNPKLPGGLGAPLPYELYAGDKNKATRSSAREEFLKFFDTSDESGKTTLYTHGIPQVLALMNAKQFNGVPPIVEQMVKEKVHHEKAIETLFLATLTRPPTENEMRLMTSYLARRPDAAAGYAGVLWILCNTNEFVLNH